MKKIHYIIAAIVLAVIAAGIAFITFNGWRLRGTPSQGSSSPVACPQYAKLCPDGSYVTPTGPNCELPACPGTNLQRAVQCLKDSDCPSSQYTCQATQGVGTACPNNDPSCVPTYKITAGVCALKTGNACGATSDCVAGDVCHNDVCVQPIGNHCSGSGDTSCPADFECVQDCGPPLVRYPDNTPPPYSCQLKGYHRSCPICLAKNTLIDTPLGEVPVQNLQVGAPVWTVAASGERVVGVVAEVGKTPVPPNHKMVDLILGDGRTVYASPGHPTVDGRTIGNLKPGDLYDGARVVSVNLVSYNEGFTYDILPTLKGAEWPSDETGFYFANGILLGSTLNAE